jgi:hypothetical protein
MNESLNYLQTFNPSESKKELLEHTLIGRKDLVDRLEELVIESAKGKNKFQRLIIGPRGSGKTHVLKVLHNRLLEKPELKNVLDIAYLCEDEYGVATFLDWIIRILRAFIRWYPERAHSLESEIEKLKKIPLNDQEKIAERILLNHIHKKTLLIIVENIGNIFDNKKGFGKKGQQKFRDFIQQNPYFTIIASNQALFVEIQKEDMSFHNFFKIIHLKKLSLEQAVSFLKSIAEWENKSGLLKFLDSEEGKGRIKAIYDLVGGNHRLLVTFYYFLKTDYINKLSETFIKTINDLNPFYQSMMDILSSQQQKIVQYLCQIRKPINCKTIAENCFSTQNIISKQMTNLMRLKYVTSIPSGRESYYELAEPLLRIYNELKENRGGPIKLFIDFLENLYMVKETKKTYMQYHMLKDNETLKPNEKKNLLIKETAEYRKTEDTKEKIEKEIHLCRQAIISNPENLKPYYKIITYLMEIHRIDAALLQLKQALKKSVEKKETNLLIQCFEENLYTLFIFVSKNSIESYLEEIIVLIEKYNYTEQFFKALPGSIFELLKKHEKVETSRFEFIETCLTDKFEDNESMIIPLKFLNIGIRHLKKHEKNVLLQLTKEERATFTKFVLDKIE